MSVTLLTTGGRSTTQGSPLYLPGATQATRYVGGTTSGPPASGTFKVGDYVVDQSGTMWLCTVAGTPGTWVDLTSGRQLAYDEDKTSRTTTSTTLVDYGIASGAATLVNTFIMPNRPVKVRAIIPTVTASVAANVAFFLHFASPNIAYGRGSCRVENASAVETGTPEWVLPILGEYEPAAGDSVTAKLQWNTNTGTASVTCTSTGSIRNWPFMETVVT